MNFSFIIGRESVLVKLKKQEFLVKALEIGNLDPASTITIGDAPVDLIMAKQNNLLGSIGVAISNFLKKFFSNTAYML